MVKLILRWTWELPQTLLGLIVLLVNRRKLFVSSVIANAHWTTNSLDRKDVKLIYSPFFGVSLGYFIFASSPTSAKHEYGHSIQSRMLGPFYLLLVGLPSMYFNLLTRAGLRDVDTYYDRYPENWADKLGGVER